MVTIAQSLDGGLDDMRGRRKIRLADPEVDDIAPLARERRGAGEHREGILFAKAVEGGDGVQHGFPRLSRIHEGRARHGAWPRPFLPGLPMPKMPALEQQGGLASGEPAEKH